ncbi:MAG: flagellar hook-length control protein FliK [Firmicutes bacterium]|nr:flagellar hook-length control protein FliK [Bacillota bacterium]
MNQTQIQNITQAAQTQQQLFGSPAGAVALGSGGRGMDFMQILQLMFSGHAQGLSGQEGDNPAEGKNQPGFMANLQSAMYHEYFPATGDNAEKGAHAGNDPAAREPALFELLALLLSAIPQSRETGLPPEQTGLAPEKVVSQYDAIPVKTGLGQNPAPVESIQTNSRQAAKILLELLAGTADKQAIINSPAAQGQLATSQEQLQQLVSLLNRDDMRQLLKNPGQNQTQLLHLLNSTGPDNSVTANNQPAAERPVSQAVSALTAPAERLSIIAEGPVKNRGDKTPDNGLRPPVANGAETGAGEARTGTAFIRTDQTFGNVAGGDLARFSATGRSEASANMPADPLNGVNRTDTAQVALNTAASAPAAAKTPGGETTPALRSAEQPLFMQLAEAIRGQVTKDGQGHTHVRLQLHPESLGEVLIKLVYKDGKVSAHFHAATESARQVIESSLGQLRETMAGHQLNLQQSTVTTGDEQGRWAHESKHEQQFNNQSKRSNDGRDEPGANTSEPEAENRRHEIPNRVNHFV